MSAIELFSVSYRPHAGHPEVQLVCQSVDHDGDRLLWIDGINAEQPVVAPLASVRGIEFVGTFRDFMGRHIAQASRLLDESGGEHSPTILARATLYMARDPRMSASEALELAVEQGVDLVDADNQSALAFSPYMSNPQALAA